MNTRSMYNSNRKPVLLKWGLVGLCCAIAAPIFANFSPLTAYCELGQIAQSVGVISEVVLENGKYAYTLTYNVLESTAYNAKGEKISGPIVQYVLTSKAKKPIAGQKIRLRYCKDKPIFFEYLESVKIE